MFYDEKGEEGEETERQKQREEMSEEEGGEEGRAGKGREGKGRERKGKEGAGNRKGQETGRTRGPETEECCALEGKCYRNKGWSKADVDTSKGVLNVTSKLRGFRVVSTSCFSGFSFLILKI